MSEAQEPPAEAQAQLPNRPYKELSVSTTRGRVKATVWKNVYQDGEGKNRSFKSVTFKNVYRDGEEWKETESFSATDVQKLELVLKQVIDELLPVTAREPN